MRRRAERLRDLWSVDVRFRPLEDDGETSLGDNDDWQVTFSDQVSIKWYFRVGAHASRKGDLVSWVLSAPKIQELA